MCELLHFFGNTAILCSMKRVRRVVLEAAAIIAFSLVVSFGFNSFYRSGINPFKMPAKVPLASDSAGAATEGIKIITLEEARQFVASRGTVLDARRRGDFEAGHIPGALLFDYYDMGRYRDQVLPLLSSDREIMAYCSEVSCDDSELLAKELYSLGFKKLLVFKGGFAEWSGAGLPVEKGTP